MSQVARKGEFVDAVIRATTNIDVEFTVSELPFGVHVLYSILR